jgi:hypothetical protein
MNDVLITEVVRNAGKFLQEIEGIELPMLEGSGSKK